MPLAARLSSPLALFRKLEREAYRAYHAKTPLHKADHFFNFCVTASSMRDYTLEYLRKVNDRDKKPYHDIWSTVSVLVAAAEIANSSKHFVLRDRTGAPKRVRTKSVRMKKAHFINVYADAQGRGELVRVARAEVSVTLEGGKSLELYAFTEEVMSYWKSYLASLGLRVRRQPFEQLAGK